MTARRTALLALYWTAVLLTAALAAGIPFTGPAANTAGVLAATAVASIGYACAPQPGGTR